MGKMLAWSYGIASYIIMFATTVYAIGFIGNYVAPKSIDSGVPDAFLRSFLINALLLGVFAVQHSVMARQGFKDRWTRIIAAPFERSTYSLLASLVIALLMWQWRPITQEVWNVGNAAFRVMLLVLFLSGWALVFIGTFLMDHFEFFGMEQIHAHLTGRAGRRTSFRTPSLYRVVRHPIMLGFLIAFWSTPRMTAGHLLFAVASTAYILVGIRFEERDLVRLYGTVYEEYRQRVPMLLPLGKSK